MMTSSVVVSSSPIGEFIGAESCFDLDDNEKCPCNGSESDGVSDCSQTNGMRQQLWCRTRTRTTKREIPPPIPSLVQNNNMPHNSHAHMPWVLRRYYTSDGRLILKEEKVGFNEYFRAHRSNGRLILDLVPFNDDENEDEEENIDDDDDAQIGDNFADENDHKINNDDDDDSDNNNVEHPFEEDEITEIEDSMVKCSIAENGIVAGNGGKCLKYSSVRTRGTCFLGLAMPAIRPVHT